MEEGGPLARRRASVTDFNDEFAEEGEGEFTVERVHPKLTERSWTRNDGRGRLWLTAAAVAALLGMVYGPLVLIAMGRITVEQAEALILLLWSVLSTFVALVAGAHFVRQSRAGRQSCPVCGS